MGIKRIINLLLAVSALFLARCSMNLADTTNGSETTNGYALRGTVVGDDGMAIPNANVFIRAERFLKDTALVNVPRVPDGFTDTNGNFRLDSVVPGTYYIEIQRTVSLAQGMKFFLANDSTQPKTINLGTIMLKPAAGFHGYVSRTMVPATVNIFVQIYGMDYVLKTDTAGGFSFNGLPAGKHLIRVFTGDTALGTISLDTITVSPAENWNAGKYLLPVDTWQDTAIVRAMLDTNGLDTVPVAAVVTFKNGRVDDMDLTGRGITIIPSNINKLRLKHLRLGENKITYVPDEVGFINTLVALNLKRNTIAKLPGSIGDLTHLGHLELSNNRLSSLPPSVVNLKQIFFLSVNYNRISPSLEPEIVAWIDANSFDPNWRATQGTEP